MAAFTIYNFRFIKINAELQTSLFPMPQDEPKMALTQSWGQKQDILNDILHRENLKFKHRNRVYDHRITEMPTAKGVYVLRISNNRQTNIEENFQKKKIENHPSCYVFIDNRQGPEALQTIAIQKLSTAFTATDQVAKILTNTFNVILQNYSMQIEITAKYHSQTFWTFVEKHQDIKLVRFKFPMPNMGMNGKRMSEWISQLTDETNGGPTMQLEAPSSQVLTLSPDKEALQDIVELSSANGLEIKFKIVGEKAFITIGNGEDTYVNIDFKEDILAQLQMSDISDKVLNAILTFCNNLKYSYQ